MKECFMCGGTGRTSLDSHDSAPKYNHNKNHFTFYEDCTECGGTGTVKEEENGGCICFFF